MCRVLSMISPCLSLWMLVGHRDGWQCRELMGTYCLLRASKQGVGVLGSCSLEYLAGSFPVVSSPKRSKQITQ